MLYIYNLKTFWLVQHRFITLSLGRVILLRVLNFMQPFQRAVEDLGPSKASMNSQSRCIDKATSS